MQYSANLNLLAAYQHFPELDANDLIVFDCIKKYSQSVKVKRQIDGGQMYFWFNWTVVKEQLPIIKSNSRRSIDAHIAALCNVGLLERHPDNKAKATSFYKLGENCEKLDFAEVTKEDYAAKTAKPEPLQNSPDLCKILPSSDIVAEPLQNSAKPLQDFAKPLQEMEKVEGETFAKSCKTFAKSCKHIIHIDSNNTVDNKLSTVILKNAREENFSENEKALDTLADGPTADEDFSAFDAECKSRKFLKILKIKKRFSNQKFLEKIAEFGESDFWAMVERVDSWLAATPKAKYNDLPAVFTKWFGSLQEHTAKNAFNAIWRAKFKNDYRSIVDWSDAEKTAIKSIFAQVQNSIAQKSNKQASEISKNELVKGLTMFFEKMPATRWNLDYFSLQKIAADFPAILAAIRNPETKVQAGETFRQKDERANEEKRAEAQQRQLTQVQIDNEKAKIQRMLSAGKEIPESLKQGIAYKQMFGIPV